MRGFLILLAVLFTSSGFAQNWEAGFDSALQKAKSADRPLVLVFAGSDWCGPCIKLDRNIWQSEAFKAYARENYVLYKADFPRKKANRLPDDLQEENDRLAEKYNPKGYFPLVVVLNGEGRVLGKTGFANVSPEEYISTLNAFVK
ncbi:thioredoxin family protein [Pseudozobellia thermophila]|nr:thioredoxin family protein [Pseudozobellia thermophila]